MKRRLSAAAAGLALCWGAGQSAADITLSQSNAPASVSGRTINSMSALFEREQAALESGLPLFRTGDVFFLAAAPAPHTKRPVPRPPVVQFDDAWLAAQPAVTGGRDWECLTQALYFEARGEGIRGQTAVAEVILNRVEHPGFPNSVCGVVNQGTGRKYQCQFTYTCDGHDEVIREPSAYRNGGKIAHLMLAGARRLLTSGATHYHTHAVSPNWARRFPLTTTIGSHRFYRMPIRLSRR